MQFACYLHNYDGVKGKIARLLRDMRGGGQIARYSILKPKEMESKIPLPTDNIYKFYALFGVMLLITSILGSIWVTTSTNEKLHSLVKEYESIPGINEEKVKSDLATVIEARIKAQASNKEFFLQGLGMAIGLALLLMWYGFRQWHTKIQPKQDEYFDLQLQKLRQEVEGSSQ